MGSLFNDTLVNWESTVETWDSPSNIIVPIKVLQTVIAGSSGPTNSQSAVMGQVTSGSLIVVQLDWADATSAVTSITDSLGNTYNQAVIIQALGQSSAYYYAKNSPTGANTVAVHYNASVSFPDVTVYEVSGFGKFTQALDQKSTNSGTTGDGSSQAITNTAANSIFFGSLVSTGFPGATTPSWTGTENINSNGIEYLIVSVGAARNATWAGTVGNWLGAIVNFIDSGAPKTPGASGTITVNATMFARVNLRIPCAGTLSVSASVTPRLPNINPGAHGSVLVTGPSAIGRQTFRPKAAGTIVAFGKSNTPFRPFVSLGSLGTVAVTGTVHGRLNTPNQINVTGVATPRILIRPVSSGRFTVSAVVNPKLGGILRPFAAGTLSVPAVVTTRLNPLFPKPPNGTILVSSVVTPKFGTPLLPKASGTAIFSSVLTPHFALRPAPHGTIIVNGGLTAPRFIQEYAMPHGNTAVPAVVTPRLRLNPGSIGSMGLSAVLNPRLGGVNQPQAFGSMSVSGLVSARYNPFRPFNFISYSTLTINTSGLVTPRTITFVLPPISVAVTGWYACETQWGGWEVLNLTANVNYRQFIQSVLAGPFNSYYAGIIGLQTYFSGPPFNLPPI